MKNWTAFALATVVAVVLSTQLHSHTAAEQISNESPVQRFYVGLVAFERNTNSVVRHVLGTLTGQPASALRPHSDPPPRCGSRCPVRRL
jgi:hypothetical protein